MERTCGAHQGAGATSTCFEASGGLQSANEEWGETRDEDEGRGRGTRTRDEDEGRVEWGEDEGRVGGDIITCDSRARREGSPHSRARAVGHEIGFRAQRSTLGPPLQDRPLPLSRLLKLSCHSNEVVYLHRDQLQQYLKKYVGAFKLDSLPSAALRRHPDLWAALTCGVIPYGTAIYRRYRRPMAFT